MGLIVIPCSMRTLQAIASGYSPDLLTRMADISLKEHRKLVMVTRETPLSLIHLSNIETATRHYLAGSAGFPPPPADDRRPRKELDQFEIDNKLFKRGEGTGGTGTKK
jgi:polyprenyl P-hydroxybenzoate/phenylacrylic acid decarboxylase-like protein